MESMKGASKVMHLVNENMDIKNIQTVLREFSKESMKMELGQEAVRIVFWAASHWGGVDCGCS